MKTKHFCRGSFALLAKQLPKKCYEDALAKYQQKRLTKINAKRSYLDQKTDGVKIHSKTTKLAQNGPNLFYLQNAIYFQKSKKCLSLDT